MKTNNIRVHLIIATFILFKSWIAAIEVQNQNINNSNKTDAELTCQKTFKYDFSVLQHCYDDSHCKKYGDCCRDSEFYNESEQTVVISGNVFNNSLYGCSGTGGMDMLQVLMINRCPQEASLDRRIRDKCEGRADDFLSANPVSSNYSGHVYKNIWCAWCNGEREQVDFLRLILFRCHEIRYDYEITQNVNKTMINRGGQWYLHVYREQNTTLTDRFSMNGLCEFRIEEIHTKTPLLRNCVKELSTEIVDGCPNGTSTAVAKACASHTYIVFEKQPSSVRAMRVFRNADCARCNGLTTNQLACEPTIPLYPDFEEKFKKKQNQRNDCKETEDYNVMLIQCYGKNYYDVAFSEDEYDKYNTIENWTEYVYANSTREDLTSLEMSAELIYFTFKTSYFEQLTISGLLSSVMYYVTYWGVWVSVPALVAHLLLFVWDGCRANSEPKNLPEKNLASLSLALLIGYTGIMFNKMCFNTDEGFVCLTLVLPMIFGFIAAFGWMFVMSVDMWLVLHASTKKLRIVRGQRYGRFVVYSLFAWLVPAAITKLSKATRLNFWNAYENVDNFQFILEDNYVCKNQFSFIVLIIPPVGIAYAVNCLLFLDTVRLIFTYDKIFKSAVDSDGNRISAMVVNRTRRNLKCFLRLSLMMGPTWIFTLLGVITQNNIVCLFNTTLNSLQGAFIFVAFDCNQDTLHKLGVFRKHPTVSETQNTTTYMPSIASTQIE